MSKRNGQRIVFIRVIFSALLNATGQILFKAGRAVHSGWSHLALFSHMEIWFGLTIYVLSSVYWLLVLARAPLSFAYPILALTFPIVVAASAIFFSEMILPL